MGKKSTKEKEKKKKKKQLYFKSSGLRTAIAPSATNPQYVTSCINLDIEFLGWSA